MANLPASLNQLIDAEQLLLRSGGTPDVWIAFQECTFDIKRPEFREVATNGGVTYFFGASDNILEGVLLCSLPEWSTLNTLTQRTATGDLTSTAWQLRATNLAATTTTASFNAKLVGMKTEKPAEGAVKVRIRLRITSETITMA